MRRILTEMFQFDLFNNPPTGNLSSPANTSADDAFALNVAERGTVLLQNTGKILPLSTATTKSIAVIGADGTTTPQTAGGGSSYVTPPSVLSPLSGIADLRRLSGIRHVVFRHRSDPGRRRGQAAHRWRSCSRATPRAKAAT